MKIKNPRLIARPVFIFSSESYSQLDGATNVNTALAEGLATLLLRTNIATQNESA